MRTLEFSPAIGDAWEQFAARHPGGTFFHRIGWRSILESALGHRTHYLAVEQDGGLCGILPLVYIDSMLFGRKLVSLSFSAHAGPLALDPQALEALFNAARELGRKLGVGAVEYRLPAPSGMPFVNKPLYEIFYKSITADPEANLMAVRGKQRNVIRKGIKAGLSCDTASVEEFYGVYSESVRDLGTPVFHRRLFKAIQEAFADDVEFVAARSDGQAVSAALNFYDRGTVIPYYWGGTPAARRVAGNDFLAWAIMSRAAARECSRFDFGRSKIGTGSYQWKVNLGFEASPLYYEYDLIRDREIPDINPLNPKYRMFIECWKRLPLPIAERMGPLLSRHLG